MTQSEKVEAFNNCYALGSDTLKQHDERVRNLENAIRLYGQLPNNIKTAFEYKLYLSFRTLGGLYYETNRNFEETVLNFERSLEIVSHGNFDSQINICVTKQMLSKSYLLLALRTCNEQYINKAELLLAEIEQPVLAYGNTTYIEKVLEVKSIFQNIRAKKLNTIVTFEVPYHIIYKHDYEINVTYNTLQCKITVETIRTSNGLIVQTDGNQYVYQKQDKYGLVNHSKITISIPKYIDPEKTERVNKNIGEIWCPLVEAINVFNVFLRIYKDTTNNYWLDNLNELMIFNYSVIIYAGEIAIRTIPMNIPLGITINSTPVELSDDELSELQNALSKNRNILWISSYHDALNQFQIKNYKEAIISINIALENLVFEFARNLLSNYMPSSEVDSFLSGKVNYDKFYLKDYISIDLFQELKEKNIIVDNPPTIYKVMKVCTHYSQLECTNRKLNSLLNDIKELRNDIVHGRELPNKIESHAEKSIDSFIELKNFLIK